MRHVRCRITGELGDPNVFYKAPNGKYYKTKELYDTFIENKKYVFKIVEFINKSILNSMLSSEANAPLIIKEINKIGIEYKDIYSTLQENCENIKAYLNTKTDLTNTTKIFMIFNYIYNSNNLNVTYSGSYCIENKNTHAVYIGESINIFSRFTKHISDLYKGIHHCEKLQNDFNESHDIGNFIFKPLFLVPIVSKDKKVEKEETLYLEAAFYLKYRSNKIEIYNTINPYIALKNGHAKYIDGIDIDSKNVLRKLYLDEYKILPSKLLKLVRNDLKSIINTYNLDDQKSSITSIDSVEKSSSDSIKSVNTKNISEVQDQYYNITNIIRECAQNGIIPKQYDYNKVRQKLSENGLIYIDENNLTVATDESLNKKWFVLRSDKVDKNGIRKRLYNISKDGKSKIINILSIYDSNEYLKDAQ